MDWFGVAFFGVLAAVVGGNALKAWRRKREYAACRRALAKIKRVRASPAAPFPPTCGLPGLAKTKRAPPAACASAPLVLATAGGLMG